MFPVVSRYSFKKKSNILVRLKGKLEKKPYFVSLLFQFSLFPSCLSKNRRYWSHIPCLFFLDFLKISKTSLLSLQNTSIRNFNFGKTSYLKNKFMDCEIFPWVISLLSLPVWVTVNLAEASTEPAEFSPLHLYVPLSEDCSKTTRSCLPSFTIWIRLLDWSSSSVWEDEKMQ